MGMLGISGVVAVLGVSALYFSQAMTEGKLPQDQDPPLVIAAVSAADKPAGVGGMHHAPALA